MSDIEVFPKGENVRVAGVLEDAAGLDTDPTAVTVKYRKPGQSVTTLEFPADVALVKDAAGQYHVDINCDVAGMYDVGFFSTGTGQAAKEIQFRVMPSRLD